MAAAPRSAPTAGADEKSPKPVAPMPKLAAMIGRSTRKLPKYTATTSMATSTAMIDSTRTNDRASTRLLQAD